MAYECDDNESSLPLVVRIFFQMHNLFWLSTWNGPQSLCNEFINLFSEHFTPSIVNNAHPQKLKQRLITYLKRLSFLSKAGVSN